MHSLTILEIECPLSYVNVLTFAHTADMSGCIAERDRLVRSYLKVKPYAPSNLLVLVMVVEASHVAIAMLQAVFRNAT